MITNDSTSTRLVWTTHICLHPVSSRPTWDVCECRPMWLSRLWALSSLTAVSWHSCACILRAPSPVETASRDFQSALSLRAPHWLHWSAFQLVWWWRGLLLGSFPWEAWHCGKMYIFCPPKKNKIQRGTRDRSRSVSVKRINNGQSISYADDQRYWNVQLVHFHQPKGCISLNIHHNETHEIPVLIPKGHSISRNGNHTVPPWLHTHFPDAWKWLWSYYVRRNVRVIVASGRKLHYRQWHWC